MSITPPGGASVVFGMIVDLTRLRTGLDQSVDIAQNAVRRISGAFTLLANPFAALAAGAGIGAFSFLIERVAASGEALRNMSTELGIGVERLQELQFAGRTSGVGIESLEKSLARLNRQIGEAASGNTASIQLFQDLGINVHDSAGRVRDAGDVLDQFADKIKATESPAERIRLAVAAFGREGARLVPLLAEGAGGLAKFGEEARRLGVVLDEGAINKARDLHDQMEALEAVISSNLTRAVVAIQGPLKALIVTLADVAVGVGKIFQGFSVVESKEAVRVLGELWTLRQSLDDLERRRAVFPEGSSALPALEQRIARIQQQIADASGKLRQLADRPALLPAGAIVSAENLAKIDQLRQKVIDAAIPDKTAQSIVKFRDEVDKLARAVPGQAEVIRSLGQAFEDVTTAADKAKQSMTNAQAAQLAKSIGIGDTNLLAGFAEIDKVKTEAAQFGVVIQDLAKRGVPLRDIFDLIGKAQDALSLKIANVREQFASEPAVLQAIRTELAAIDFGDFARGQDAIARSLAGVTEGAVKLTEAGVEVTRFSASLDTIPGTAAAAEGALVTVTGSVDALAQAFARARFEALLLTAVVGAGVGGNP